MGFSKARPCAVSTVSIFASPSQVGRPNRRRGSDNSNDTERPIVARSIRSEVKPNRLLSIAIGNVRRVWTRRSWPGSLGFNARSMNMPRVEPRNVTRFWRDRRIPGLSLMCADFTTHEFPSHVHEAFVVAVTEAGGAEIKSRGIIGQAHPTKLFVFNPGEPHAGWMGWSRRWRYRAFYLERSAIDAVAHGLGIEAVPYFVRNDFDDHDLIESFLSLHGAMEDGRHPLLEQELLIDTFGRLFQRHGSGGSCVPLPPCDRNMLKAVADLMRARYADHVTLDDLGQSVGLTRFQLIGLFKRTIGLTPHAYLNQIRLNIACSLLKRGVSIADAAAAAGFYDQSALTKYFKRCYAITPKQFAAAGA
jgi:AraC-like DNA-binding protein